MVPCPLPSAVGSPARGAAGPLILVAPPWPLFNRPSIQLAVLKAYLASHIRSLAVDTCHWHLRIAADIGFGIYDAVCRRTWLAEAVYAALLYPPQTEALARFFHRQAPAGLKKAIDFESLVAVAGRSSRRLIDSVDWSRYRLAGFSIGLCQLTASLYFIREIKTMCPDLPVVVGGSTVTEDMARGLVRLFSTIDFAVCGEGEKPMAELIHRQDEGFGPAQAPPRGVVSRQHPDGPLCFNQTPDLDGLPMPDFDDYFTLLAGLPAAQRFFPTLPLEMSRGCFWQSAGGKGCAFCNLNRQWRGFRKKSADRIVAEADRLTHRHQVLGLAYTDNALPLGRHGRRVYRGLAGLKKDIQVFGEIRATTSRATLTAMRDAGVDQVQIGIEALSSRLLAKINKGTCAMDNVAVLRNCRELGIRHRSNLMMNIPGSDAADVAETLANLPFVTGFEPLQPVRFWLGEGSPIWQSPKDHGLRSVFNHPYWARLFPEAIASSLVFGIQAYKGELARQVRLWAPVRRQLALWQKAYAFFQRQEPGQPVLSWRDAETFLIIRQRRLGDRPITHRLRGESRRIYLFCQNPRSFAQICGQISGQSPEAVRGFLAEMVAKKLMFTENGRYLSLAVPAKGT